MLKRVAVVSFMLFGAVEAFAQSPAATAATALDKARAYIARHEYAAAVNELEPALRVAPSIADQKMRDQASAAMHFYAAVAYAGMNQDKEARSHLREFFVLSPGTNHVDAAKYDRHFVVLFDGELPKRAEERDTFAMYYPGFAEGRGAAPLFQTPEGSFGDSPVLELLATPAEKKEWHALQDASVEARTKFVTDFWQRRDTNPQTPENEFRTAFDRRVAFADEVFGVSDMRGSLSDRGKVFVLLGVPSFVRRRPIKQEDQEGFNRVWAASDAIINGTIEQWIYMRELLPIHLIKPSISFRFVTQEGIGIGVWQKEDAYTQQALFMAGNPNAAK